MENPVLSTTERGFLPVWLIVLALLTLFLVAFSVIFE